ncbi:hypothetical protein [Pseudomonas laurylsulfatiphila]|nr:hypothetical protein [Pseudomonas reinekei]
MVVNDNACELDKRGAVESIAGKPAPTGRRFALLSPTSIILFSLYSPA